MASTRNSSKKVSKAARSSKAAKSSKTATARTNKAIGASAESAAGAAVNSDVDHPPVIITKSSAAISLAENVYRRDPAGGNRHVSADLRLLSVGANRLHEDTKSPICYELDEDEVVEIIVTSRIGGGGPETSFTITGGNAEDGSESPVVNFDHGASAFPPGSVIAGRRRFRNVNRQIVSLEIFSPPGSDEPVHTCSVVENNTNCEISIFDDHV
jgi:hypothetical protein